MLTWTKSYSVFFTSVPRLLTHIKEAKTEKTPRNQKMRFERFDLVICDELRYVGFDKESAEMLFNHLSLRTIWYTLALSFTRSVQNVKETWALFLEKKKRYIAFIIKRIGMVEWGGVLVKKVNW